MEARKLFERLLRAEDEETVDTVLINAGYFNDDEHLWHPFGGIDNNFSAVGNQQGDPAAAFVEKIINGIDAMLMAKCYECGFDPEGTDAPSTMTEAVARLFDVRDGHIENLTAREQTELARNINVVAVGRKPKPNYLIIDAGEGQTPARFHDTLLSLMRSNKIRIPFVQGKFNSGGTGVLQFCGTRNYQLIASRRNPHCPVLSGDTTGDLWGFTIVRRLLPANGRRSSMYVYLAPNGDVPSFKADAIRVLPGGTDGSPIPYAVDLPYGTCIKLYDYQWPNRSTLTTEGRFAIEQRLFSSGLPCRLTETREYRGHTLATTVVGGWTRTTAAAGGGASDKLEIGFPASLALDLPEIGQLPYQIAVYTKDNDDRRVPSGAFFVVNGQVHGELPDSFITHRLKFDYLTKKHGPLCVSVDCTHMDERVREDFFMASRDRIRRNEVFKTIEEALVEELKSHPGLQALNQARRQAAMEQHLNDDAPLEAFQNLIDADPSLAALFSGGDRLATRTGPGERPPFVGRKFPTFFRVANTPRTGLVRRCPLDRTCAVRFETDAVNDYFTRGDDPGLITMDPPNLLERSRLWNGEFEGRFRVPWDARVGDEVTVTLTVSDVSRALPFTTSFTIIADPEAPEPHLPGLPPRPPGERNPRGHRTSPILALPKVVDVHRDKWDEYDFDEYTSVRVRNGENGSYDVFINVDSAFLITELNRVSEAEKPLQKRWFTMGLALAAIGMIRYSRRRAETLAASGPNGTSVGEADDVDLDRVSDACSGIGQVIIPIIRSLSRGPTP